jgi:hypothetical protein
VYGLGYAAVFIVFYLLHAHALRRRDALALDALEVFDTRTSMRENLLNVAVASASIALARTTGHAGWAGLVYMTLAPILTLHGRLSGRKRAKLVEQIRARWAVA